MVQKEIFLQGQLGLGMVDDSSPTDHPTWVRFLESHQEKEKAEESEMDYTVLSVAVMTLGMLMVVEVLIHKLDNAARGRPYFTAVLTNIYSELATLGLVEFFLFLITEYYENYDKEKKHVFAAVHFTLFYTAILNAFQSVIFAFAVGRVSRKMWEKTEALELDHYVEIREEFDQVLSQLKSLGNQQQQQHRVQTMEDEWSSTQQDVGVFRALMDTINYPRLKSRYNRLLVQVRFHELRVHFLRAYNLPPKLKIADYLSKSQQHVLIKLVHVSSTAWLLLTASINVLYFMLGIFETETRDPHVLGATLIDLFFTFMVVFIILALLLWNKVHTIFAEIMHRRELWEVREDFDEKQRLVAEQMSLFWGSSPKLIVAAIQFMQFGYAVALSSIIMFWEELGDGGVARSWYVAAILMYYCLFVAVAAQVIPRYTLCTSLGQLVDEKRLGESIAKFHLEQAKRQRQEEIMHRAQHARRLGPLSSTDSPHHQKHDNSSKQQRNPNKKVSDVSSGSDPKGTAISVADLVAVDTDALRTVLSKPERDALTARLAERGDTRTGRRRVKSAYGENGSDDAASVCQTDLNEYPESEDAILELMAGIVKQPSLLEKLREYFLSKRYPVLSNVFGTMAAFFIVGSRIEHFMHTEGIVSDEVISFDFSNTLTFWAFTGWLAAFILMDVGVLVSLGPYKVLRALSARKVWVAAGLDLFLCTLCLGLFYIAELERCCELSSEEGPHEQSLEKSHHRLLNSEELLPAPCACQAFGSRTYGGLGRIEPFISIIGLRLFRFWLAARIVKRPGAALESEDAKSLIDAENDLNPFELQDKPSQKVLHGDQVHKHFSEENGTIAELWESAVWKHPEIVLRYGAFSGELLQAMLGIPIIDPVDKAEMSLPKPLGLQSASAIPGHIDGDDKPLDLENQTYRTKVPRPMDRDWSVPGDAFDAPDSRLVRSMRRCQRKLLPILDQWTVVDVVMTRFEIVYFDVAGVEAATKQGKGLRLSDVAAGRRVVGHLSLSEITSLRFERGMSPNQPIEDTDLPLGVQQEKGATASRRSRHKVEHSTLVAQTRHGHTLFLRFYDDSEDAPNHSEVEYFSNEDVEADYSRKIVFQWAKTIYRICGPEQLHQPLPHFGGKTKSKLRSQTSVHSRAVLDTLSNSTGHRPGYVSRLSSSR